LLNTNLAGTIYCGYTSGIHDPKFPTEGGPSLGPGPNLYNRSMSSILNPSWASPYPARPGGCVSQTVRPQHLLVSNWSPNLVGPHYTGTPVAQRVNPNPAPLSNSILGLDLSCLPPSVLTLPACLGEHRTGISTSYANAAPRSPQPMNTDTMSETLPICIPPMHLLYSNFAPTGPAQASPATFALPVPPPTSPVLQSSLQLEYFAPTNHPSPSQNPNQAGKIDHSPSTVEDSASTPGRGRGRGRRRSPGRGSGQGSGRGRGRGRGGGVQSAPSSRRKSTVDLQPLVIPTPNATPMGEIFSPVSPLANKSTKRAPRKRKSNTSPDDPPFKLPPSTKRKSGGGESDEESKSLPAPRRTRRRTSDESERGTPDPSSPQADEFISLPARVPRKRRQSKLSQVIAGAHDNDDNEV
jgi:hypothetical protein